MKTHSFVYLEPKLLKEALLFLDNYKDKVKVLSGGTNVVPLMKLGILHPQYLMSLKRLPNLKGIQKDGSKITIGSTTTLREIIESPLIHSSLKGIVEAAKSVATPQIQNIGTIAGNILQDTRCLFYNQSELVREGLEPCFKMKGRLCRAVKGAKRCFSVYQGDLAPILIALKGKAKLEKKGGSRTIPISELFSGNGRQPINIESNELLTKIILPLPKHRTSSSYQKLRMRGSIDYPLASVASVVNADTKGNIIESCVVLGAAGSSPKIVPKSSFEEGLKQSSAHIESFAQEAFKIAEGVNNQPLDGIYRRKMIKVLVKRAYSNCLKDIYGEQ